MTQKEIDKVYSDLAAYEKEIADHNEQVINKLGKRARKDFAELMDCCNITDKINFVDAPKGKDNQENCGIYKNIHVDQWSTNMEGDSYAGFIYANVNGQWIEIPYSC